MQYVSQMHLQMRIEMFPSEIGFVDWHCPEIITHLQSFGAQGLRIRYTYFYIHQINDTTTECLGKMRIIPVKYTFVEVERSSQISPMPASGATSNKWTNTIMMKNVYTTLYECDASNVSKACNYKIVPANPALWILLYGYANW